MLKDYLVSHASFVGLLLMTAFMQLFGMALSLAASAIGARLFSKALKLVLAALLAPQAC